MAKKIKSIKDLAFDDKNINKGSEFGSSLLAKSLQEVGAGRSVLADKNGVLIAGNKTVEAFGAAGNTKIKVVETTGDELVVVQRTDLDINSPEGAKMKVLDNTVSKHNYIEDAEVADAICLEYNIDKNSVGLTAEIEHEVEEDNFEAAPPLNPITVLGDVYELNQHRLICGDATSEEVWSKLGTDKNTVCFTSPPYNVSNNAALVGNRHAAKRKSLYQDDSDNVTDYSGLLHSSLTLALNHTGGVAFNVQPLANNKIDLLKWISHFSKNFNEIIVWNKSQAAPAMAKGVLSAAYEWIVVFSDKQTRSIPLSSWRGTLSNVYNAPPQRQNEFTEHHAATFPIHLPKYIIADLMNRCASVVDCFAGTGTTLIAAEQLGKKSFGIEIGPGYCDIIVARFIKYKRSQSNGTEAFTVKRNGSLLSEEELEKYLAQITPAN